MVLDFHAASSRVRAAQTPYGGNAWAVPGTIEVENFDEGGEGIAFHDLTATNAGSAYRNNAVDIYASTNASNGYYVLLRKGEWLEYTVSVEQTALYELSMHVQKASPVYPGVEIRVLVDGLDVAAPISVAYVLPNSWIDFVIPAVVLKAGDHILHVELTREPPDHQVFGTGLFLDYLTLDRSAVVPVQGIAGSDQAGFADGPPAQARFSTNITGMDIDLAGNIYVVDAGNYRIRKISPAGDVTTFAGTGTAGTNDASGSQALFDKLGGLVVDNEGNCYVIDHSDLDGLAKIRKVSTEGNVTTYYSIVRNRNSIDEFGGFLDFAGITLNSGNDTFFLENHIAGFMSQRVARLMSTGMRTDLLTNYFRGYPETLWAAMTSGRSQTVYMLRLFTPSQASALAGINYSDITSFNAQGTPTPLYRQAPGGSIGAIVADLSGNVYFAGRETAFEFPGAERRVRNNAIKKISGFNRASAVYRGFAASGVLAADLHGHLFSFQNNRLVKFPVGYRSFGLAAFTDGGGTVLVDPPDFVFQTNQVVQITAVADAGWTFLGWTNDISGTQTNLTIVMTNHLSLEAVFAAPLDTPATNGIVKRSPDYTLYPYATTVQLTAAPDHGFEFVRWNDGFTNSARSVEVTNVVSLSPLFSAIPRYTLTATALGGTGGTVSRNPDQAEYFRDTRVTVTARPSPGYVFQVWLDNVLDNPRLITITSNRTLFAAFAPGQGTAPVISAPPRDTNVFIGGQAAFAVFAEGSTPLEYQWKHNGTNIPDASGPLLLLSNVQSSDAGVYTVTVANTVSRATAEARLNVVPAFSFDGSFLEGGGQIRFSMAGPPGTRYAIEQSDDLKYWQEVRQVDIVSSSVEFTDTIHPSNPKRFYRARLMVNP